MATAVIAAPVPLPTIAPMPTMANAGTLIGRPGNSADVAAANAPPRVAPMNSDGEKMPPDEPEPRLTDRRQQLARHTAAAGTPAAGKLPGQGRLDRRVADAFDVVMAAPAHQRVDQHADQQHAERMAQVAAGDFVEQVLGPVQARTNSAAATPTTAPSTA